jgi:hypothetical protein
MAQPIELTSDEASATSQLVISGRVAAETPNAPNIGSAVALGGFPVERSLSANSRVSQGLPLCIADPLVLKRVARLLNRGHSS